MKEPRDTQLLANARRYARHEKVLADLVTRCQQQFESKLQAAEKDLTDVSMSTARLSCFPLTCTSCLLI